MLGIANQRPESPVIPIWLGWACTLFIFQLLHFFLPVTAYMVIPIFTFGVVFAIAQLKKLRDFPQKATAMFFIITVVILMLGIAAWVASRAMLPPTIYDSGLYHFNAIRWINTYPVVPGIGNLHGRLAFNQSFFLYVAALNFYPFFGHGRSLANSFLLLLVFTTLLPSLVSIIRQPLLLTQRHPFAYVPDLLAIPFVAYLAISSDGLASPSPDLSSTLLQLIIFIVLAHTIAERVNGQKNQNYVDMVLVILAATAVTIKLSNLMFSAVIIGFVLTYAWKTSISHIHTVRILLTVAILILVWGGRGLMLSGMPLYPSIIGHIPVDWAIPKESAIDQANWIYGWARQPGISHWSNVLGNWNWLKPWLMGIFKETTDVVFPLESAIVFCIITTVISYFKQERSRYLEWSILLPLAIALIYWFFTAPDPRFAHALFFLLSMGSSLLFLSSIQSIIHGRMFIAVVVIVLLVSNVHFIDYIFKHSSHITSISISAWHPVKQVPLQTKVTSFGLVVYTPIESDQCWDSPLLATPYFNDRLRLRNPNDISSGFTVTTD